MPFRILLLFALLAPFGACAVTRDVPPQDPPAVRPAEPFVFEIGETVRVMDETLTAEEGRLVFEEVVQDSRCPLNVDCVRAGEAEVRVRLHYADGTVHEARLEIPGMRRFGVPPAEADFTEIAGYTIRFLRLDPYPVAEQEGPAGETTGIFVLERLFR